MPTSELRTVRLSELAESIASVTAREDGTHEWKTAIRGLSVIRSARAVQPFHRVIKPTIWITVQGCKQTLLAGKQVSYRAGQAFILPVEVPCRCSVEAASPRQPYLGVVIELDREIAQEVAAELEPRRSTERVPLGKTGFVLDLEVPLLDCVLRSLRLLDTPEAIAPLYPGIMRELCYWLLSGPKRNEALHMTLRTGTDRRIERAAGHLRKHFNESTSIEQLARSAGMSPATFHRQFKAFTLLSPLQYQKQLRLLESRRLVLTGAKSVENVAFEVGYISSSQFSREYRRMFGYSPRSEMAELRQAASDRGRESLP